MSCALRTECVRLRLDGIPPGVELKRHVSECPECQYEFRLDASFRLALQPEVGDSASIAPAVLARISSRPSWITFGVQGAVLVVLGFCLFELIPATSLVWVPELGFGWVTDVLAQLPQIPEWGRFGIPDGWNPLSWELTALVGSGSAVDLLAAGSISLLAVNLGVARGRSVQSGVKG